MKRGMGAAFACSLVLLVVPGTALAYVGPGLGVGAITAFFGAIFAVLLAIVGVIWYPIKRLFSRRKPQDADGGKSEDKT